jgi:hypothetical protein
MKHKSDPISLLFHCFLLLLLWEQHSLMRSARSLLMFPIPTFSFSSSFFFPQWHWDWPHDLVLARQALYHLSHSLELLFYLFFFIMPLLFWPEPALDHNPPTYTFHVVGIIDVYHHSWLVGWDGVSLTFARLALNHDPPNLCLPDSWDYRSETPHLTSATSS